MKILITEDGKRLNLKDSIDLYEAPCNPPDTGMAYTQGTDLRAKKGSKSGKWYFYMYSWSLHQGSIDKYYLVSEEAAKTCVYKHLNDTFGGVHEENCIKVFGKDFFTDDA